MDNLCPVCGLGPFDDCPHALCDTHGWTTIADSGSNPGFTGVTIWWATLACGCSMVDDSNNNIGAVK